MQATMSGTRGAKGGDEDAEEDRSPKSQTLGLEA